MNPEKYINNIEDFDLSSLYSTVINGQVCYFSNINDLRETEQVNEL